ncbi:hypothetical protein HDZ31DRAFT_83781 [Schizophyllum fasciatum]
MSSPVDSHFVSTCQNMNDVPVINYRLVDLDAGRYRRQLEYFEYHWGLKRGDLDLTTPLNHIMLRKDMAERMNDEGWILMPTKDTMGALLSLAEHNSSTSLSDRKAYTAYLPETEYEYEFVPLYMKERDRPRLYISDGATTKVFRAPYSRMPRIKARTHPLYVIFRANRAFSLHISKPRTKARLLGDATFDIVHHWTQCPPIEFLVGPNVWKEHRHPLSDDGSVVRDSLHTPVLERRSAYPTRNATKAPCRQARSNCTRTSIYGHVPRAIKRTCTQPHPQSGSSRLSDCSCDVRGPDDHVRGWVATVSGDSMDAPPASHSAKGLDQQLAHYQKETARDPRNALRVSLRYNVGGLVSRARAPGDYSTFSSNDWARYLHRTCLWSSQPPKQAYADYVDLIT